MVHVGHDLSKIVKIMCKNQEKSENICIIYISTYIGIKFCSMDGHILNKDTSISFDTKLNKSKLVILYKWPPPFLSTV